MQEEKFAETGKVRQKHWKYVPVPPRVNDVDSTGTRVFCLEGDRRRLVMVLRQ